MTPSKLLSTALLMLVASAFGCLRSNQSTIVIGALCYPTDSCEFSSTCDKVWMTGSLSVDLTVGNGLVFPMELDNQRSDNSGTNDGVNTNAAVVDRFDMRYQVAGRVVATAFSQQSIVIPTDGSTVAGIWLIPAGSDAATALATLAADTVVTVLLKARGSFHDGTSFETGEHPIPVTLANGKFTGYPCTADQKVTICPPNVGQSANVKCE